MCQIKAWTNQRSPGPKTENNMISKFKIENWKFTNSGSFLSRTPGSRRKSIIVRRNSYFFLEVFKRENNVGQLKIENWKLKIISAIHFKLSLEGASWYIRGQRSADIVAYSSQRALPRKP